MSAHELDHLALAVESWAPAGERLNRELGARWASGFTLPVFSPCQLALADDMRIELLVPGTGEHSFIRRFLDNSDGQAAPHHITFKVHNIRAAIKGAQQAGIEPVLVNLDHPAWQEAFLHPRDTGLGFLAQMVQAPQSVEEITEDDSQWTTPCPWVESDREQAQLLVIHGQVASLDQARIALVQVLGAHETVVAGETPASLFSWDSGAELFLEEIAPGRETSGIRAIGVAPANPARGPGHRLPDLRKLLGAGSWHQELGLRIAPLVLETAAPDA